MPIVRTAITIVTIIAITICFAGNACATSEYPPTVWEATYSVYTGVPEITEIIGMPETSAADGYSGVSWIRFYAHLGCFDILGQDIYGNNRYAIWDNLSYETVLGMCALTCELWSDLFYYAELYGDGLGIHYTYGSDGQGYIFSEEDAQRFIQNYMRGAFDE